MAIDVTDATFQTAVIERSREVPIVVDLWAPWCGPCRTLVEMVKVNVDENPAISQAFQVQSIPLVVAIKDGQPVDGFMGAQPEPTIREFIAALMPSAAEQELAALVAAGDEASLEIVLARDPGHAEAVVKMANLRVDQGRTDEALALLARIPESDATRQVAARARLATNPDDDYDERLNALLDHVKADEDARQQYVDILELMGAEDPRTAQYRKKLTSRLF
jgi:putative thioredoxin